MSKFETTGPQVWLENWIPPQIDGEADLPGRPDDLLGLGDAGRRRRAVGARRRDVAERASRRARQLAAAGPVGDRARGRPGRPSPALTPMSAMTSALRRRRHLDVTPYLLVAPGRRAHPPHLRLPDRPRLHRQLPQPDGRAGNDGRARQLRVRPRRPGLLEVGREQRLPADRRADHDGRGARGRGDPVRPDPGLAPLPDARVHALHPRGAGDRRDVRLPVQLQRRSSTRCSGPSGWAGSPRTGSATRPR